MIDLTEPYDRIDLAGIEVDLQGWGDQDPIFEYVIKHWAPQLIIEIGTWKGASAVKMAELQKSHGIPGLILCVDTWLGSDATLWRDAGARASLKLRNGFPTMFRQFAKNVVHSGHADRIRHLPMTTLAAAQSFLQQDRIQADAIYIDAGHSELEAYSAIVAFYRLLKPGGILFGDDYWAPWPGVVQGRQQDSPPSWA